MMEQVLRAKYLEVTSAANDVLACRDEHSAGFKHPPHFAAELRQILRVVQDLPPIHEIEAIALERQLFPKPLDDRDRQAGLRCERADGTGADQLARVRLQGYHSPPILRQCEAADTSPR